MAGANDTETEPSQLRIADIGGDLLANVLQRLLPSPGLIVTAAAQATRSVYVTARRNGQDFDFEPASAVRAAGARWRTVLARAEVPAAVAELPLWCRSCAAEALYSDAPAGLPALLVCKQWHCLIARLCPVTAVICGRDDQVASSIETLIVAWDWHEDAEPVHLRHLTALTQLRTLVCCNTHQYPATGRPASTRAWAPLLPAQSLPSLRHVVCFAPRPLALSAMSPSGYGQPEFVRHVSLHSALRTLVLPDLWYIQNNWERLLVRLPHLETFMIETGIANLPKVSEASLHLTSLRSLRARASPAGSVAGTLECLAIANTADAQLLAQLSALSRLTRLDLACLSQTALGALSAAPALLRLSLSVRPQHYEPLPLAELSRLTHLRLHVRSVASANIAGGALGRPEEVLLRELGALHHLRHLDLVSGWLPSRELAVLTQLVTLALRIGTITTRDCDALSCLTKLERLCILQCTFMHAEPLAGALQPLTALRELRLELNTFLAADILDKMRLTSAHPRLEQLELMGTGKLKYAVTGLTLSNVGSLCHLREVSLLSLPVNNEALTLLGSVSTLRVLVLRKSFGWDEQGLLNLAPCKALRVVDARGCEYVPTEDFRTRVAFTLLVLASHDTSSP